MFILELVVTLLIGILAGGYIVKNNKDKAFKILDDLHLSAQKELADVKAKAAAEAIALRQEIAKLNK